jgi:hypothetical protein
VLAPNLHQHILATPLEKKVLGCKNLSNLLKKMGSTTKIDKDNVIEETIYHLPEGVHQLLEERKKMHDEEDPEAALASIKVDRRGKVTMELSTNAIPNVSDSSSSVTLEQVKNMLAD